MSGWALAGISNWTGPNTGIERKNKEIERLGTRTTTTAGVTKNMNQTKPKIQAFIWDPLFMAIDWEVSRYAFDITVEDGGARILILPPVGSSYPSIGAAISASRIKGFTLRLDRESGLTEVLLE